MVAPGVEYYHHCIALFRNHWVIYLNDSDLSPSKLISGRSARDIQVGVDESLNHLTAPVPSHCSPSANSQLPAAIQRWPYSSPFARAVISLRRSPARSAFPAPETQSIVRHRVCALTRVLLLGC